MSAPAPTWPRILLYLTIAALVGAGVLARFIGLGSAPLSIDEYYFVHSIENVLRAGVPRFSCGGLYTRGLSLQYLAAALHLAGMSVELAPRIISAVTSVLALPAAYILGRRAQGRALGVLALIMVALSVWEIEMGRFGRMYAPFQAVFLWYLVFFVKYTVDRSAKALWPMILLSVAGPLIWEGGIFLPAANFLPVFLQQPAPQLRTNLRYLCYVAVLFVVAGVLVSLSLGGYGEASLPPGFSRNLLTKPVDAFSALSVPISGPFHHLWWTVLALVPAASLPLACRWIWRWRSRAFTAAGLAVILAAAVLHQFSAVISLTLLLLLMQLISWDELFNRAAAPFHIAIALCALFWLAFGLATVDWHTAAGSGSWLKDAGALAHPFLGFPDFLGIVIRPWARAVPILGSALLLLTAIALLRTARYGAPLDAERALEVVLVMLLLAACASEPARQETRYEFFLYPLLLIVATRTIQRGVALFAKRENLVIAAATVIALGGFALTEDFQPRHLLRIDHPAAIFRYGMTPGLQAHLEIRDDFPAMAAWLKQQVAPGRDLVVSNVHALDHYYPAIDYFFADQSDPGIVQWSCRHGSVERWGNYPLLYTLDALTAKIAASSKTYVAVFTPDGVAPLLALTQFEPRVAWSDQWVSIVVLQGTR